MKGAERFGAEDAFLVRPFPKGVDAGDREHEAAVLRHRRLVVAVALQRAPARSVALCHNEVRRSARKKHFQLLRRVAVKFVLFIPQHPSRGERRARLRG
ncbi:hypothetical protein JS73_05115 [Synergistes jonesii]|nr:hypothetical protein JS73_05115 [Synergistes jonesii]OFB63876.1 hypothetical protein JS72_06320 [Synergistes jonesii]OFB64407.1 hypothetical protein JS79_05665 [Synergistes jonesii]OFB68042.1 hypothetical protein JS78_05130 [Synergistes jonesii]OFB73402.1 hypothetical protein JS77_05145 [Synergistes jonesii]